MQGAHGRMFYKSPKLQTVQMSSKVECSHHVNTLCYVYTMEDRAVGMNKLQLTATPWMNLTNLISSESG